jgi:hypothetical protein
MTTTERSMTAAIHALPDCVESSVIGSDLDDEWLGVKGRPIPARQGGPLRGPDEGRVCRASKVSLLRCQERNGSRSDRNLHGRERKGFAHGMHLSSIT